DGVSAQLGLPRRPDHEAGMVAGGAVGLLLPGQRVLGQKGEAPVDRGLDVGRLGAELLGRGLPQKDQDNEGDDKSHVASSGGARLKARNAGSVIAQTSSVYSGVRGCQRYPPRGGRPLSTIGL